MVGRWTFAPDPDLTSATANAESDEEPITNPHKRPELLTMDQVGNGLGFVAWSKSSHGT